MILAPGAALDLSMFPANSIFVLDFDGVMIEQCEEKLFRLPEKPGERQRLEDIAAGHRIDPSLYGTQYLRHLVYQAEAVRVCQPYQQVMALLNEIEIGGNPYFILTARSGLWAVSRLMEFVGDQGLAPQEVFCLGRASKADILRELLWENPDRHFVFLDDTQRHIDAACKLTTKRLTVVHVTHDPCTLNAERLATEALGA